MIDGSPVDTWHHKKRPIGINRRLCVDRDRMAYNVRDRGHYAIIRSSSDGRDRSRFLETRGVFWCVRSPSLGRLIFIKTITIERLAKGSKLDRGARD